MLTVRTLLGFDALGDTYMSVADADEFHADRGNTEWGAANTNTKEEKLRQATDYLDFTYSWRTFDAVPAAVQKATAILAAEALTTPLVARQDARLIKRERVRVEGAIEEETEYADGVQRSFPHIDAMMRGVAFTGGFSTVTLVRA
ncbi:DnaT-like ssDNA-binding protein [Pacificimonas sp. ICDLI1SI03]